MLTPVLEGLGQRAARGAVRMPGLLSRQLFGEPPRNDRGAPLDEQIHVFLNLVEATGQGSIHQLDIAEARRVYRMSCRTFDLPRVELDAVTDRTADGPGGGVPVRVYRPRGGRLPACVYFHGGGFAVGCVNSYDGFCRELARRADCVVVSVDYRLAPEHCFPAPVDDCVAAYRWVEANADALGVDAARIAVGGDSAGGNLATVVCQELLRRGQSLPARQMLLYPSTDQRPGYASRQHFSEGFFLDGELLRWFGSTYLDGRDDVRDDPRVSPILFDGLDELPPAYVVTAGFDPLRDEGEAYAARLDDAGVPTVWRSFDPIIHGFITMGGLFDAAESAVADICEELRRQLH